MSNKRGTAMKKLNIVLIGGHLTPALAVLEAVQKLHWKVYWFGYSGDVERQIVSRFGITLLPIESSKLQRFSVIRSLFSSWKLLVGFFQSLRALLNIRPDVVCGFGSYVSVPVIFAAWVLRIPIVIHEQTAVPGLANRLVSVFANKIAISFPESRKIFPKDKTIMTGNLIRESLLYAASRKTRNRRSVTMYITGGSRGSSRVNQVVSRILSELLKLVIVHHQTGSHDFAKFLKIRKKLPLSLQKRYHIAPYFPPGEIENILAKTDLAISRAGANTVLEFALFGIPAVFIPLPFASFGEQKKNAQLMADQGMAVIVDQEKLTKKTLLLTVKKMLRELGSYRRRAARVKKFIHINAVENFLKLIQSVSQPNE